jgi:hypothetical protein
MQKFRTFGLRINASYASDVLVDGGQDRKLFPQRQVFGPVSVFYICLQIRPFLYCCIWNFNPSPNVTSQGRMTGRGADWSPQLAPWNAVPHHIEWEEIRFSGCETSKELEAGHLYK